MFNLKITDIYKLSDGRTILAGVLTGTCPFSPTISCDLIVDGKFLQRVRLDGERLIPSQRLKGSPDMRHFETMDDLSLSSGDVENKVIELRG